MSRYAEAFKNLAGPGDARPTALQIVKDEERENTMQDKVFLVTGCSSGVGLETARALAATGGRVYGFVRDLEAGNKACEAFLDPGRVELVQCDLASFASVRAAADEFKVKSSTLNVLICNAAIMSVPKRELTVDGFELQLATNYLGHFLLFHLLKDVMIQSSTPEFNSRLVQVSSASHHFSEIQFDDLNCETAYDPKNAYGQSKLAQIYLANYVDRHFGAQGLHGLSLMPGGIRTNILRHVPSSVVDKMMAASDFLPKWYKSPEQGAATTLVAAIGQEYEGRGGLYLEDCDVAKTEPLIPMIKGVKEYAFDEEKQDRLYKKTLELLKLAA